MNRTTLFRIYSRAETRAATAWLELYLERNAGWHKSPDLCSESGMSDRTLRQAASNSKLIVSGRNGFRHIRHATPGEIHHFLYDLKSRARELLRRHVAVSRTAHQLVG